MSYKAREPQGLHQLPEQVDRANPPIADELTESQKKAFERVGQLGIAAFLTAQMLAPDDLKPALSATLLAASFYTLSRSFGATRLESISPALGIPIVSLTLADSSINHGPPVLSTFVATIVSAPISSVISSIIDRTVLRRAPHAQFDIIPPNA